MKTIQFKNKEEEKFWREVYLAALSARLGMNLAESQADFALASLRERQEELLIN